MSEAAASYVSGVFGLIGVVVGAAITQGVATFQRRRRHKTYWAAISAEADLCHGLAQAYLRDRVMAPLYRMPNVAYEHGFAALLADGVVSNEDAKAVIAFYGLVEQFNRGLSQAHEADNDPRGNDARLHHEAERLELKAQSMLDEDGPYARIRKAINHRH